MEEEQSFKYYLLSALRWAPRVLCILFIAFVTLFSFDVFGQGEGFWKALAAFLMHNIPTFILIIVLLLSWKWQWIGGLIFIAAGIAYLIWLSGRGSYPFVYITLFTIGILFILDWFLGKKSEKTD